jgi:hypothetical protein
MTSPTRFPCGNVSSYEHVEKDAVGFVPEPALVCGDRIVWKRSGEEILARQVRRIDDSELQRGLRTNFSYFYQTHDELRVHLRDFVDAYNFARRLKTLSGLTPYEFICKTWTSQPQRFTISPLQKMPGLNI